MRWAQAIHLIRVLFEGARAGPKRPFENSQPVLRYTGSSTIAHFIRDARMAYAESRFILDTESESSGGELAILEQRTDLAGVARHPLPEALANGLALTAIGHDTIAVIVNPTNRTSRFTRGEIKAIFTGAITNWKALSGPNLPVQRFIPAQTSATHEIFKDVILDNEGYVGCEAVIPTQEILTKVCEHQGGIGFISSSFLYRCERVTACAIEGRLPRPTDPDYAIRRPLYLLSWPGQARVEHFISWAKSSAAHPVLLRRFAPWV